MPEPGPEALTYYVVDVFTERPFAGNPLAVVFGGEGLTTAQCQAIAREFNLSETTFPLPPSEAGADYRVRIFTPAAELPFAGHPTIGTAWLLHHLGRVGAGRVVQECGVGLLELEVASDGLVTITTTRLEVGDELDPAPLLSTAGLAAEDLTPTLPGTASAGLPFAYLPVRRDALARASFTLSALPDGVMGVALVAVEPSANGLLDVQARVVARGVGEDPATGSAALGLGAFLVARGLAAPDGQTAYDVRQGGEIGRPSLLHCTVTAAGGTATAATVSGRTVLVASGQISRPG